MIHSPEISTPKLTDYTQFQLDLKALREQSIVIQKLQDEIRVRNENPNWIGTDYAKEIWNNNTGGLCNYLEILESKLRVDVLKLTQKYT